MGGRKAAGPADAGSPGRRRRRAVALARRRRGSIPTKEVVPMASSLRPLARHIQPLTLLGSGVILLALLLAPGGGPAWAQGPAGAQDPSSPESITQNLVGLAAQGGPLQNLVNVAAARQQRLLGLMDSDPASVLRVAIPRGV